MGKTALVAVALLASCKGQTATTEGTGGLSSVVERVFRIHAPSEKDSFMVRVRATPRVSPDLLTLLQQQLRLVPATSGSPEQLSFWHERPMVVRADRAEVQIELLSESASSDATRFVYMWPDPFRISRPGVLEVRPGYEGIRLRKADVGVVRQALGGAASLKGHVQCGGNDLAQVTVVRERGIIGTKDDLMPRKAEPRPSEIGSASCRERVLTDV